MTTHSGHYRQTVWEMFPTTAADAWCAPDGPFHRYRKRFLRHPVCTLCGHVMSP